MEDTKVVTRDRTRDRNAIPKETVDEIMAGALTNPKKTKKPDKLEKAYTRERGGDTIESRRSKIKRILSRVSRSQLPEAVAERKSMALELLELTGGVVTPVMNALGLARQTYYDWCRNDPEFAKQANHLKEIAIDFAETELMDNIRGGREASIFFFLKCQAKHRGYVERSEISGPDGGAIEVAEKPSEGALMMALKQITDRKALRSGAIDV
jgi:hypothetical protein